MRSCSNGKQLNSNLFKHFNCIVYAYHNYKRQGPYFISFNIYNPKTRGEQSKYMVLNLNYTFCCIQSNHK